MAAHSENLSAYLDGELTAAEIAELEAEFAADPGVRAERDELESVMDFVRSNGPLDAPAGFAQSVLAKVAEEATPRGGTLVWLRRPMGIPLEALAVAAAAVFVLVFALNGGGQVDSTTTASKREVFDPKAEPMAASPAPEEERAEEEQARDDGAAMVAPTSTRKPSPRAISRPSPKSGPRAKQVPAPAPVVAPAPSATTGYDGTVLGTDEVEALQQLGTKGDATDGASGSADEGEAAGAETTLAVVPYNYTLHSSSSDVLKQLDRVARRHGGELRTSTGEVFRPAEMSPGTSRVVVSIPNTQMSAFTAELRSLGQVVTTSSQSFFPGDSVQIQIDVSYQFGATYAPSATTEQKK